jgi:hypothetical protein
MSFAKVPGCCSWSICNGVDADVHDVLDVLNWNEHLCKARMLDHSLTKARQDLGKYGSTHESQRMTFAIHLSQVSSIIRYGDECHWR